MQLLILPRVTHFTPVERSKNMKSVKHRWIYICIDTGLFVLQRKLPLLAAGQNQLPGRFTALAELCLVFQKIVIKILISAVLNPQL